MKTLSTLTFLFSLIAFGTLAQNKVSGVIKNQKGQVLAGAAISIKDSYDGATSDKDGKFSFTTDEKESKELIVNLTGYEINIQPIVLNGSPIELTVVLEEVATELNTVVVTAGTMEANDRSKMAQLKSLDIATTAGAEADIISALQTLPGTQAPSGEQGLMVRGGAASETKMYFDGMLIKNPYLNDLPDIASRGRFSPFMFKGMSFSAGGYSAQYGQALSSALVLESKDLEPKTTTGVSIMSVGGGLLQTNKFKRSSLQIGGQYINLQPYYELVKQDAHWNYAPRSYSASANYKLKTGKTGLFKFYSEFSSGELGLSYDNLEDLSKPNSYNNSNHNFLLNSTYQSFLTEKVKLDAGVTYSTDRDSLKLNYDNIGDYDRFTEGRAMLTVFFGRLSSLRFGGEYYNSYKDQRFNDQTRNFTDNQTAAFAETDYYFTRSLVARFGLRLENSSLMQQANLAPRLSLSYKLNKNSQTSLAYGRFYQSPEDNVLIVDRHLDFQSADHYILNYQYMTDKRTFRAEAFYKNYDGLIKHTGEAENYTNTGNGYARGIDIFWRDRKTIPTADYWISYSFLDTKRNFKDYPVAARPDFAAKHTLSLVYKHYLTSIHSQVGFTYTYASGRPYYNPNNVDFMSDRTKDYHNLSMNISYLTRVMRQFTVVYLSINNVPGFNNIYGYNYSKDGSVRQPIEPPAKRTVFLGMFITIGSSDFNAL
ncbi:TonB-dependent receptor [Solitalea longa]|uniref:TonB-dependent receptor n=1 Tax=Solitalea longa TaxID=2079460 RepID=A0A2S5A9Y8_9SPHI|nr:TonB-dependent receptor [Solitalea longa]POY39192.1 TonB-dependent receptor [Solitalea longa]